MSKKNSNVNLKNNFKDNKDLSTVFLKFRNKLDALKKRKYRYTGFKLELDKKTSSKEIGFSRLTQIFRQS